MTLFLVILLFLGLSIFLRIVLKSWLAPPCLLSLLWTIYLICVSFISIYVNQLDFKSLFFIFICVFIFCLPYLQFSLLNSSRNLSVSSKCKNFVVSSKFFFKFPYLLQIIMFSSFIGMLGAVVLIYSIGYSLISVFSLEQLASIAHKYSVLRYSAPSFREPSLFLISSCFNYLGAFLAGLYLSFYPEAKFYKKTLSLSPVIISLFYGLLLTTRASIYFVLILLVSSYLSSQALIKKNRYRLLTLRNVTVATFLLLFCGVLYCFLQILRWGDSDISIIYKRSLDLISFYISAFWGSVVAFSYWFKYNWDTTFLYYGKYVFPWFYKIFGINPFIQRHSFEIGIGETTVITFFGELINDFSIIGTLIFFYVFGILSSFVFKKVIEGHTIYIPILTGIYGIILTTPITFIFKYTTIFFAWILFLYVFLFLFGN